MKKPTFSGHESFHCKTQWLKRGYDFIEDGNSFNDEDAVLKLGVGKNMVSAIKYWMKAFGLYSQENSLTKIAHYLFDDATGKDRYLEDTATLWLLHYNLVRTNLASIYNIAFVDFHKQRNEFEKDNLQGYVRRLCHEGGYQYLFNDNTVRKDINVLLQSYVDPDSKNSEDYSALLLGLSLIMKVSKSSYCFNNINHASIIPEIFLYAVITERDGLSVSFDLLTEIALVFCLTTEDLLWTIKQICDKYHDRIVFSDVAGVKQLQFKGELLPFDVLDTYFNHVGYEI
jgi:hypothetical protein